MKWIYLGGKFGDGIAHPLYIRHTPTNYFYKRISMRMEGGLQKWILVKGILGYVFNTIAGVVFDLKVCVGILKSHNRMQPNWPHSEHNKERSWWLSIVWTEWRYLKDSKSFSIKQRIAKSNKLTDCEGLV